MSNKIRAVKGRSKKFKIFVKDTNGNPVDLTGHSIIRLTVPYDGGSLKIYAPLTAGVDEVQTIIYPSIPDAGSFKIKIGDETTAAIAFGATGAAIAAAINALKEFGTVGVVGDISSGSSIVTFAAADGKREQPLMAIVENILTIAAAPILLTIVETQKGSQDSGITVVEEKCGELEPVFSVDNLALLDVRNDQPMDLYVRIGADDLDLEPIRDKLDVEVLEIDAC